MRLDPVSVDQLVAKANEYLPPHKGTTAHYVWKVRSLLLGRNVQQGRRGPLGAAGKALALPGGSTAAILLAMEETGFFLTHAKTHPMHDPDKGMLTEVCRALVGGAAGVREMRGRIEALIARYPTGSLAKPKG